MSIRHDHAFDPLGLTVDTTLDSTGFHSLRSGSGQEDHLYSPKTIIMLQQAVRSGSYEKFKEYTSLVDEESRPHTLRALLELIPADKPLDIDELLNVLGLYEHRHKLPNQLSGGQQQRVSIGRAIIKNPDILLCDEPTGALDYKTSKEILELIEDVNRKYNNTVIMVTHNEAIRGMSDHVIRLRDGVVRHDDYNTHKISAAELDW